jgi:hypothetical protein
MSNYWNKTFSKMQVVGCGLINAGKNKKIFSPGIGVIRNTNVLSIESDKLYNKK